MSYPAVMSGFADQCARFKSLGNELVHPNTVGVHAMDNAPAFLFDYATSAPHPAHSTGEAIRLNATKRLQEWNKHDSVSPLMHDGKALVTFSIMLHESDSDHRVRDVVGSDAFTVADESDGVDPDGESHPMGQVGYKESQQLGLTKQGRVDYITTDKIQQAYDRVVASLHQLEMHTGRKRVDEHVDAQWDEALAQCPNAMELFNVLNRLPYANDRSPDILVIASVALCIPQSNIWLPTLISEHFEHRTDSDEWRKPKVHAYWRQMVDAYVQMLSPYLRRD